LFSGKPEGAQGEAMKRSSFSEEQIACALRLAESGTPVVDVCRHVRGLEGPQVARVGLVQIGAMCAA
jgi:hypothetical protein